MKVSTARFVRLGIALAGVLMLAWVLNGQAARPVSHPTSLPTDWSHSHLIFSRPGTLEKAARVGADPRYWQQLSRREVRFSAAHSALTAGPLTARPLSTRPVATTPLANDPFINERLREIAPPEIPRLGSITRLPLRPIPVRPRIFIQPNTKNFHRDWSEDLGSGANAGAANFPAKYSFNTSTANCGNATTPDYVVYSTGLNGASDQPSIVAFSNLYSGCTGTTPALYWSYNTAGQILTSPVLSQDGSQVAFVQTNLALEGTLVVLKWAASTGTLGTPATPTVVLPAAYPTCTAPCMTEIVLADNMSVPTNDTTSSVFYDYSTDVAWVGGAFGWLHKVTGLFKGTPAEIDNGTFPVQMNPSDQNVLSSPVYDYLSNQVFVGDAGGFLYRVDPTSAAVIKSSQLDFGTGIVEGPVVDSTNGLVYVFSSSDGTVNCPGPSACAAVFQLTTAFASGDSGTEVTAGTSLPFGQTPNPMLAGSFDNDYYTSGNATGNLYVCGNTGAVPTVYQIPIQASVLPAQGNVLAALTSTGNSPACSPVTDILNPNLTGGATERFFVSTQNNGVATGCGNSGCIFNFIDTPWQASTSYQARQQILDGNLNIEIATTGGTSGSMLPAWSTQAGVGSGDNSVQWLNQGPLTATPLASWTALHLYTTVGTRILDTGGNIEVVTRAGLSGVGAPTWNATLGGSTTDGLTGLTWINAGPLPTAVLPAAGGTSGIIIDNTVNVGVVPGASQIYFTTLSNQACSTSGGTGGCAVQASQPGLQ